MYRKQQPFVLFCFFVIFACDGLFCCILIEEMREFKKTKNRTLLTKEKVKKKAVDFHFVGKFKDDTHLKTRNKQSN